MVVFSTLTIEVFMKSITFKPIRNKFGNLAFQDSTMSVLGEIAFHQLDAVILEHHKLSVETYFQIQRSLMFDQEITVEKN